MRNLTDLALGEGGTVRCLRASGGMGRRMMDLGFTAGARVECLLSAPGGGMRAYRVRRAVIALRKKDARTVILEDSSHE